MKLEEPLSETEIVRRREEALKRMLATPHKPHAPLKAKRKRKASPKKRK